MTDINEILEYLKNSLSEKRYRHSIGVAEEAVRLAQRYSADKEKAYLAGILHDIAKEIDNTKAKALLIDKYGIKLDEVTERTHKLLHAPLGACMAQSEFNVTDPEILDAIKYHTTAKADMSLLTKIIYMADYIEPNRDYDDVDYLRKLAYEDIDKAIIFGIDYTINELLERGNMFHLDTVLARNFIIMEKM